MKSDPAAAAADVDEAVDTARQAVTDAPDDLRTSMLISLANALITRMRLEHEQEGDLALLIDTPTSVRTQRPDNSSLAQSLMILSDRLQQRADRVRESDPAAAAGHVDEAVDTARQAVTDAPYDLRTSTLISLANALTDRVGSEYEQEGDLALLIDTQRALTQRPDNSRLAQSLMILSDRLQQRADRVRVVGPLRQPVTSTKQSTPHARRSPTRPMTCSARRR